MVEHDTKVIITSGTIFKVIAVGLLIWALFLIRDVVLILLTAIVIASAIEPGTQWFMRRRIPRVAAVIILYSLVAILLAGFIFFFMPPLVGEVSNFVKDLPHYIEFFSGNDAATTFGPVTNLVPEGFISGSSIAQLLESIQGTLTSFSSGIFQTIRVVFGSVLSFILIVVISFYLAVQEKGIENFLRVVTPLRHEDYAVNLWRRTQNKIGKWLQGQLVLAIVIGVLVFLGLTVLGVEYAFLLAVLAAIFELIPIFGPILAAVPAAALGFADSATLGLLIIGLYIIIQQFENHLIYPVVVTKIVGVPPLLVILALLVGLKLAGFLGFILAIPAAAFLVEIFHDVEKDKSARLKE